MATMSLVSSTHADQATRETGATCPSCGHDAALLPLGARIDRPHRWRPWVVAVTPLAICAHCGALAATEPSGRLRIIPESPATPAA